MWHNGRRVSAARSWAHAREQFASVMAERDALQREFASLQHELDVLREDVAELRSITGDVVRSLRERADQDIVALRSQLASALLRLHQRDLSLPLH